MSRAPEAGGPSAVAEPFHAIGRSVARIDGRAKVTGAARYAGDLARPNVLWAKAARSLYPHARLVRVDAEQQFILQSDMRLTPNLLAHESVNLTEVQNWTDMLNPKWRGKMVMTDPRKSGDGLALTLFLYYSPELGPEYVRRLFGEMDVTFSPDQRQNAEWVRSGRMLLNLRPENREVTQLLDLGAKVQVVPTLKAQGRTIDSSGGSDGILFLPNLDPLPHPNATKVYVNWFYSKAGQQAMVDIVERASRRLDVDHSKLPDYARPVQGVEYLNLNLFTEPEQVEAMRDEVTRAYGR